MPTKLTHIQQQVYDYMLAHMQTHQAMPTRTQIAGDFGWASTNAADTHVKALVKKGWLAPNESRTIPPVEYDPTKRPRRQFHGSPGSGLMFTQLSVRLIPAGSEIAALHQPSAVTAIQEQHWNAALASQMRSEGKDKKS